jgi:hypothetical protein
LNKNEVSCFGSVKNLPDLRPLDTSNSLQLLYRTAES